jgi:hypothetical protein
MQALHAGSLHPVHFEQDTTVIFGLIRNPFPNHAELATLENVWIKRA